MSERFKFQSKGIWYEVSGSYGTGQGKAFTITRLLPGAKRMLGAPDGTSGIKIEKAFSVSTEQELRGEIQKSFPDYTDFQSY